MTLTQLLEVSNRPDPRVLHRLDIVCAAFLGITALLAVTSLVAWLVPGLAAALPATWVAMKFNTALVLLLATIALSLGAWPRRLRWRAFAQGCGVAIVGIAAVAVAEHLTGRSSGFDTLVVADPTSAAPGRMSLQGALCFLTIGALLALGPAIRGVVAVLADMLTLGLGLFVLLLLAGVLFDVNHLVESARGIRPAPLSLFGISLLTFVLTARRTPHGLFSLLTGVGIGSQVARLALPASIALTFVLIRIGERLVASGTLSLPYAAAVTAAGMAAILVILIFPLAGRINQLEADLRTISLADELTGCHNRRGFDLIGAQVLREARRAGTTLTVLFVDADGLKAINDTLGHDAGSAFLCDLAALLRDAFRGSDVLGRIGGDEFAVLAQGAPVEVEGALERLRCAAEEVNQARTRPYRIGFSIGEVTVPPESDEPLAALLTRADAAMYAAKRQRRAAPEPARPAR